MNNERYVARGWSGGVMFIEASSGSSSRLCEETCFPQVLMGMGQVALTLWKVWISLLTNTAVWTLRRVKGLKLHYT